MSRQLKLFRAAWGCTQVTGGLRSWDTFLSSVKKEGYTGIELPLVFALELGDDEFKKARNEYGLECIFQLFSDGPVTPGDDMWKCHQDSAIRKWAALHPSPNYHDIDTCIDVFKKQVECALPFKPCKLNSHSLRDFHSFEDAHKFFNDVLKWSEQFESGENGVPIMHETHRKRFFHSPWVCRDFVLPNFTPSDLKMVSDYSHFTCVAEVDPSSEVLTGVLDKLAPYVCHIHARVGYDHGPQVSDPRAPEWIPYTEGFEKWWDEIFRESYLKRIEKGDGKFEPTLSPEHGPPNYQMTLPYSQAPLADIWEVNSWIGERQRTRWNALIQESGGLKK